MSADSEWWPPPNEPAAFESLCLDLWREIWNDPGAQKNGRSGQAQAGVDVFGVHSGRQMGVQCKQKDGLLPLSQVSLFPLTTLAYHDYEGIALDDEEKPRLVADLGIEIVL